MKAIYLTKKAGPEGLIFGKIEKPEPNAGEVLIKIQATTVMPAEFQWFPTFSTKAGEPREFPIVLSHEFSGEIESLGAGVTNLKIGDAVYGMNDWFANGALAEFCVAPATALAPAPKSLDHVHAAAAPISALTAWQGLFDRTNLQRGQRILIHGAAGGVGTFAVQLAHWCGAHVIATASTGNLDFVRSLGASEVIDYEKTRFEDELRDLDAVFDAVGGDTLRRSWKLLRTDGKLVTIASSNEGEQEQRTRDAFMLVQADGAQLAKISDLIDGGELRVFIQKTFPLNEAREAFERASKGKMRGKIAVSTGFHSS